MFKKTTGSIHLPLAVIEKQMAQSLHILVYKDTLLTYLLVSVQSFLTLRYPCPCHLFGHVRSSRILTWHFHRINVCPRNPDPSPDRTGLRRAIQSEKNRNVMKCKGNPFLGDIPVCKPWKSKDH